MFRGTLQWDPKHDHLYGVKISQIQELDTAKQVLSLMENENSRLHARLETLIRENAELRGESGSEQLALQLMELQEQLASMQHARFGTSSERRRDDGEEDKDAAFRKEKTSNKTPKNITPQVDLPIVTEEHVLPDDDCKWQRVSAEFWP